MFLAILADSHDNILNLKKVLDFCKKKQIKNIIHCGDLCQIETLIEAWPKNFDGIMHFVLGNADNLENLILKQKKFFKIKIYGKIGKLFIENKKIAFTHYPEIAEKLNQTQKYDYIFYGHTHKPWEEKKEGTILVNPGNIANIYYQPSFALLDLEKNKLSLKILNRIK